MNIADSVVTCSPPRMIEKMHFYIKTSFRMLATTVFLPPVPLQVHSLSTVDIHSFSYPLMTGEEFSAFLDNLWSADSVLLSSSQSPIFRQQDKYHRSLSSCPSYMLPWEERIYKGVRE